jgi:hypothetical protein
MTKKVGGVKITMRRVEQSQPSSTRGPINLRSIGECPCGKSCADCDDEWDAKLKITSRTSDDYHANLEKVRRAELDGVDPYHSKLRREAEGVTEEWGWTPHMPPGSFKVPLHTSSNK